MLTDEQWAKLEHLFNSKKTGMGRPRLHTDREVLNGILWILGTGSSWLDMPVFFPSYSTCYRRFCKWEKDGRLDKVQNILARDLEEKGLNPGQSQPHGTFAVAKKGANPGSLKRDKGAQFMVIANSAGCLSPWTQILLTLMKDNPVNNPEMRLLHWENPDELGAQLSMCKTS